MIIANPIYDVVFKLLMQNQRIARFFIETILEETVEEVELKPKGLVYENKEYKDPVAALSLALALVRFDFLAIIKTANGERKKVLIEIQKARHPVDIVRFRNYLGLNYQVRDEVYIQNGKKVLALPIITIYLLGFKLNNMNTPALKIGRQIVDQINKVVINHTDEFIELLTHNCHIVQIPLIENKLQTKLEQLLSIFEQNNFVDENGTLKEYKYMIEDPTVKEMTDILNHAVQDPKTKEDIDAEQEAYRVYSLPMEELNEIKEALIETKEELTEFIESLSQQQTKKELEEKEKEIAELKRKLGI